MMTSFDLVLELLDKADQGKSRFLSASSFPVLIHFCSFFANQDIFLLLFTTIDAQRRVKVRYSNRYFTMCRHSRTIKASSIAMSFALTSSRTFLKVLQKLGYWSVLTVFLSSVSWDLGLCPWWRQRHTQSVLMSTSRVLIRKLCSLVLSCDESTLNRFDTSHHQWVAKSSRAIDGLLL